MYPNNPKLLEDYILEHTKSSEEYSMPVPASFLQSVASLLTIKKVGMLPTAAISFTNPRAFGRELTKMMSQRKLSHSSLESDPLRVFRHSNQVSYINLFFKSLDETSEYYPDQVDVHSLYFKRNYLKTPPSEWRLLVYSRSLRRLRASAFRNYAGSLYNHLVAKAFGKDPSSTHRLHPSDLLPFAEALLSLYTLAKEDIRSLDSKSAFNSVIAHDRHSYLVDTAYTHVIGAIPLLQTIIAALRQRMLPAITPTDLIYLANAMEISANIAEYLPMHQGLLRCLYPYIASLVDERIILPVCPMSLDVNRTKQDKDQISRLHDLTYGVPSGRDELPDVSSNP